MSVNPKNTFIKPLIGFVFLFAGFVVRGNAVTEPWEHLDASEVPWVGAVSIGSLADQFMVLSATGSHAGDSQRVWRSEDGDAWTPVPDITVAGVVFQSFAEHGGALFGFGVRDGSKEREMYRTADGLHWEKIGDGGLGPDWSDSISFGSYLYAADVSGRFWKSLGTRSAPAWEELTPFAGDHPCFAVFHGHFYSSWYSRVESIPYFYVSRTVNGTVWEESRSYLIQAVTPQPSFWPRSLMGLFVQEDRLFSTHVSILDVSAEEDINAPFTLVTPADLVNPVCFPVLEKIHCFGSRPSSNLSFKNAIKTYNRSISGSQFSTGEEVFFPAPDVSDMAVNESSHRVMFRSSLFLLPKDLWRLPIGVRALHPILLRESNPSRSQKKLPLLAFSVSLGSTDTVKSLTVHNEGTAREGKELEHVSLWRLLKKDSNVEQPSEFIADLVVVDGTTWKMPDSFHIDTNDNDTFVVVGDIADKAEPRRTVRMEIPAGSLQWEVNRFFSLGIQDQRTLIIEALEAQNDLLSDVVVYPSPATDRVRFLYDLDSVADVSIKIYDVKGDLVSEVDDAGKAAGTRLQTSWDSSQKAPGVYVAVIRIRPANGPERRYTKKILVQR